MRTPVILSRSIRFARVLALLPVATAAVACGQPTPVGGGGASCACTDSDGGTTATPGDCTPAALDAGCITRFATGPQSPPELAGA